MKKLTYIISAISVLLATSCTNELETNMQEGKLSFSSINASMADLPTSRTHLEGGGKVVWDNGDKIGIFSDMQTIPVVFECTNINEKNASFVSENEVNGSNFYAYYPYENTNIAEGKLEYTLLQFITYKEGSFYRQCPVIAKSNSNNFSFKQTCGILSFSVLGSQTIEKLILKGNNGEPMSGTGYIDIDSDIPTFIIPTDGGINIGATTEMYVNKKLSLNEATIFYFIVPIGKYTNGITLTISGITDTGESFNLCKTTPKCVDISRGVIKSFSVVDTNELIEDYQADVYSKLMAFYSATGGDNWINNTNWGSDKPFKEWYGITADDIFISKIDLSSNNLTGSITGELNSLDYLQELNVNSNSLSTIQINSCLNLNAVLCDNNQLISLDVADNKCLGTIHANDNILNNLCLSSCHSLHTLSCHNNLLTTLDLSDCSNMQYLNLFNNKLKNIDISQCVKLYTLDLQENQLKELNVINKNNLHFLSCGNNQLVKLIVSDCKVLQTLTCNFNNLTSLNINNCPNLETLWCHQNYLKSLDVTAFPKLWTLWCGNHKNFEGNELTNLDISKNTLLEEFSCYGMKLNSLDVSKNTKLWNLECSGNPIQFLNVDNLADLKELWCHTMNLSGDLDVSNNINLDLLFCDNNPNLKKIYISSYEQVFDYNKDESTKFCIKGNDELYDEFPYYSSTDYSKDGTVTLLQQATIGKGIDIVLMGDAYTDRLIADGTYENMMKLTMENFFSIEPYKSFRNYFNVYMITAVSKNELYTNTSSTALSCYVGIGGNDNTVFNYAQKAVTEEKIDDTVIIVVMNEALDEFTNFGVCRLYHPLEPNDYGKGASISYFCVGSNEETFRSLIYHEAGGHAFAKLGDEYAVEPNKTIIPIEKKEEIQLLSTYGWLKNIDLTNNSSTIKWNRFLNDKRYQNIDVNEDIGIFESAYEYKYGVYRPSLNGTMNTLLYYGYNAPSREAIYYRIHKLAYGEDWQYNYEKFVEYDAINRNTTISRSTFAPKQMPPLHEPIIIKDSWKNAKSNVPSRSVVPSNNNVIKQKTSSNGNAPSMKSTISHRVALPNGRIMITTHDVSGKTSVEYENK